jgi:hypothetical protein
MLQEYREARLREMKDQASRDRFGEVCEITKADWMREVNDASKSCWVVVHLSQARADRSCPPVASMLPAGTASSPPSNRILRAPLLLSRAGAGRARRSALPQDAVMETRVVEAALTVLAAKFREVKVVKIVSTAAIENWPDARLPAMFLYHDGEMKHQLVGADALGGRELTPDGAFVSARACAPASPNTTRLRVRSCCAAALVASPPQTWSGDWRCSTCSRRSWKRRQPRNARPSPGWTPPPPGRATPYGIKVSVTTTIIRQGGGGSQRRRGRGHPPATLPEVKRGRASTPSGCTRCSVLANERN